MIVWLLLNNPDKKVCRKVEKKAKKKERNLGIAKTMLSSGYKADEITRLTGLSISELHKLP
jgi:hypothetical protein